MFNTQILSGYVSSFGIRELHLSAAIVVQLSNYDHVYLEKGIETELLDLIRQLDVISYTFASSAECKKSLQVNDFLFDDWSDVYDYLLQRVTSPNTEHEINESNLFRWIKFQLVSDTLMKMSPSELICANAQCELNKATQLTYSAENIETLKRVAAQVSSTISSGGRILLFGNGGSAADSQHIAAEFVSKLKVDRRPLPAIALTTDTSALTAIGNDYGFEHIFERQVQALATHLDTVIGITTSGKSQNVINGLRAAKQSGAKTIIMTGKNNFMEDHCDFVLNVHSDVVATIQEIHIQFGHMICELSEQDYV